MNYVIKSIQFILDTIYFSLETEKKKLNKIKNKKKQYLKLNRTYVAGVVKYCHAN